jgi:hypothetical protein
MVQRNPSETEQFKVATETGNFQKNFGGISGDETADARWTLRLVMATPSTDLRTR